MDSLSDQLAALTPPTFKITNIIRLEPEGWQVNIADDNGVIVGTGDTIELALDATAEKAANHQYVGRFSLDTIRSLEASASLAQGNLFEKLGFKRQQTAPIKRRI